MCSGGRKRTQQAKQTKERESERENQRDKLVFRGVCRHWGGLGVRRLWSLLLLLLLLLIERVAVPFQLQSVKDPPTS